VAPATEGEDAETASIPDEAVPASEPGLNLAETWKLDSELLAHAPGGDLDGTEALARAMIELFPILETQAAPAAAGAGVETPSLAEADVDVSVDRAIGEGLEDEAVPGAELPGPDGERRRSRRGRRGGRGRRRGASHLQPVSGEATPEIGGAAPSSVEAATAGPAAAPEAPVGLFTADPPLRTEKPWRERGPQRRWGRTFPRDPQVVSMPPPKPSGGSARFAPIPQAVPPAPVSLVPSLSALAATPFVLPDIDVDEPLRPGETRTERLLAAQTRLLRTALEGQARQIEMLTANVAGLQHLVGEVAAGAGITRTYQPRTGIFVDAPNVCYAAETARVTLDFGRMLKYLARDRHLVHALSYSPIIDDVREGIRYETQRFVAPFLRTGYKLITKPLKRFSDGSAKGNFDIELALDILTMADRLDVVVLVSGDSDFECVIEHIQARGVRVEVVAFANNVSTELVNVADSFIDIMQHLEHFKAL